MEVPGMQSAAGKFFFSFFGLTVTFQHLDKLPVVLRVVPSAFPPGTCVQFLSRIPLFVDFHRMDVANSRSRGLRESTFAQEKVPKNLYMNLLELELMQSTVASYTCT